MTYDYRRHSMEYAKMYPDRTVSELMLPTIIRDMNFTMGNRYTGKDDSLDEAEVKRIVGGNKEGGFWYGVFNQDK